MSREKKDSLAEWVLREHYPESVFTPLTVREREIAIEALRNCGVANAPDRLHAEWARHLADVYNHYLPDKPGRVWYDTPWSLYQWPLSKPIYFGGDEYLRKTLVLHLPLLGRIVVAITKPGYFTEDGEEKRCR